MRRNSRIEFDDYIAPDGEIYTFDDGVDKFLLSHTGGGMPPIEYITQQGPNQHGETVVDYRLGKRVIQYIHRRNECDRQGYWEGRNNILDLLRPNRQSLGNLRPGALRKKLPGGSVRQIDVFIQQGPEFAARDLGEWNETSITETLRFIAHDPTFYDPTAVGIGWAVGPEDRLIFPVTLVAEDGSGGTDMLFGSSMMGEDQLTTYTGTWQTFPLIYITGPMQGPVIRNLSTGEYIALDYSVSGGEVVTITLDYGNKTVTNNFGVNLIGIVTSDSDLATFHIAPAPEAVHGENIIRVIGGGAIIGVTKVELWYYTRYIGI